MHPNVAQVQAALERLGVTARIVEFERPTRTAREAADAIGTTVAQIAKSIVFTIDDEPILVIASGANRVSIPKLSGLVNGTVAKADADAVRRFTGFPIGGVPPVGHPRPVRTLLDRDLLDLAEIWAAGGTPAAVFPTTPAELLRISGAEVSDIAERPGEPG